LATSRVHAQACHGKRSPPLICKSHLI
jgi:hypothetical protein